jgi:signal transduction histidine kinase/ActR/RegA family two-component response regulator
MAVYQELIDFAAESGIVDLAHVMMPDPTSPDFLISPVLWSRHEVEYNPLDRFPRKKFQFSDRLAGKNIVIIQDAKADDTIDENTRQLFLRNKVRSAAIIPIHSEDRWLATLILDRQEPNPPSHQDLQPFLTLCDQAAIILDNQQLLDETEALYRVSRALNQAATVEDTFEITLREIAQYTGLEQCHIVIYDENADLGKIVAHYNQETQPAQSWLPMTDDPIYKMLADQQQPVLVVNDSPDTSLSACETYLVPMGLHSSMLIPAISKNRLLGFIALDSYSGVDYFHRSNIAYAQAVSDQFTIALESIRRFEEIQEANNRLRELDQLKTQFLANMSHELRTPLNSIIGFSRVILKGIDGPTTAEQEEDLTSIHNSGQHLLSLINDILDVARIEAGKMSLAFEDVDIEEMANSVNATVRGLVKDKNVELDWHIEKELPLVEADAIRLRQILLNFLSNAAKFTEKGYVSLYIFKEGEHHIHLAFKDTGIGIAEEDFDVLFEAFEQVDSSVTRSFGGTGLGLPITKKLVELHHGRVWLESEIGQGSIFHVLLPIRQSSAEQDWPDPSPIPELMLNAQEEKRPKTESQDEPTILLVDDEPGVVNLYERYLRSRPYKILRANSGAEAIQTIQENNGSIHLILLDINMPGLNGWDVLQIVHDNPATKDIPVIVCSIENEPNKAAALGARQSLLKPIVEDDLLHALQKLGINE